jgi:hypothetical protein
MNEEWENGDGGYGYDDTGAEYGGGAEGPAGVFRAPDGHWTEDQSYWEFADALITAFHSDPKAIEAFYDTYAEASGLRRLAAEEAAVEAAGHSPKFGSKELQSAAREFLRRGREQK